MSRMPTNDNLDSNIDPGAEVDADEANDPMPAELAKLRGERDSLFDRLARAQADYQNSRKRLEAEADQRLQYANANLIKSLLPVLDYLERAMAVDAGKTDAASVIKGLQLVLDQFNKALADQQVELIAPNPGDPFDPNHHEALMQQPSDSVPPGHVTQLLQKGYALRDRTLRPAQVAVARQP